MHEIANCPYAVPGLSDGGAHIKFLTTGMYPTEFLETWVRDHEVMDLEQAHWRLDRRARGWKWTVVNGEVTFEDGECTRATPGRLLRHGRV